MIYRIFNKFIKNKTEFMIFSILALPAIILDKKVLKKMYHTNIHRK